MSDSTPRTALPRGIRNNNPGNIDRDGTQWQGLARTQTDPRFCVFVDPQHGIRALAEVLLSYRADLAGEGELYTIRNVIARWAPGNENDTAAYIDFVAGRVGFNQNTVIDIADYNICAPVVNAIIAQENADYAYPVAMIESGLGMAGIQKITSQAKA